MLARQVEDPAEELFDLHAYPHAKGPCKIATSGAASMLCSIETPLCAREDGEDGEREAGKYALDACNRDRCTTEQKPSLGAGGSDGG